VICRCLFFFQAEDGIRDFHVTGVQTCALPISAEDTVVVTIVHVNRAPVADAGEAFSVNEREGGQLQGSGTDPDGDTVTYAWTQVDGPAVTLDAPNAATTTFTAPEVTVDATATFKLTVSDGALSGEDTVVVSIVN